MAHSTLERLARASLATAVLAISACDSGSEMTAALDLGVDKGYPGAAAAVRMGRGRPLYAAAGYADIENAIRLKPDACFHIGSITKTFTAVAALRLVDKGVLALDATLADLLPSDVISRIPYADRITLKQLLDHSSGVYATNNDLVYLSTIIGEQADPGLVWRPADFVARAYEGVNEPSAAPGEGHHYSDTNYILLGMIVERATGTSLKTHVTDTVLTPLGMTSTTYLSDYLQAGRRAPAACVQGYMLAGEELRSFIDISPIFEPVPGRATPNGDLLNTTRAAERIDAAAGLLSNLPDLLRYGEALFSGALLSAESQSFLMSAAAGLGAEPAGTARTHAMQAAHKDFGVIVFKEGDGPGGVTAILGFHPQSASVYAAFTNSFGHFDESSFLQDVVMPAAIADALTANH